MAEYLMGIDAGTGSVRVALFDFRGQNRAYAVADIAELRDFARQLSHIGNNLNQIAAFFNSGGIQSRAMLEEINRCMTDLRSMRKDIAELAGDYRGNLKTRRR